MLVRIGQQIEVEYHAGGLYVRPWSYERVYNRYGLAAK
jgi:hypothetical protein